MYSSKKDLIEKLESEKKRLQDNFSQLGDYVNEVVESQYQQVDNYFSTLIDLINNELNDEFLSDDVTKKYENLRDNWLESLSDCYDSDIYMYETTLPQILDNFKVIKLFSFISKVDSTTVIIGANGAGKSSLINELRKNSIDEMYVLPAQKLLYFVLNFPQRNDVTKEKYIYESKKVDIKIDTIDLFPFHIENTISNTFTKLITLLVKDYTNIVTRKSRKEKDLPLTLWDRVERIWNQIFPEIIFELEPDERVVKVEKMVLSIV